MKIYGELPEKKVVFAACDSVYFIKYATPLVYSAFDIGKNIHIHVCNPSTEVFALACVLAGSTENTVTFTFNEVEFPANFSTQMRETYYACLRFLLLPELLITAEGVLTIDIDSLFNSEFRYPDESLGYFPRDSISSSDKYIQKASRVAAGVLWVTRQELQFAKSLREKITKTPLNWFADQIAIYECISTVQKMGIKNFNSTFLDWNFRDSSVIWTGKGKSKDSNPVFLNRTQVYIDRLRKLCQQKIVILHPRLDIPFKRSLSKRDSKKEISDLRLYWDALVIYLKKRYPGSLAIRAPLWMFNNSIEKLFPNETRFYAPHHEKVSFLGKPSTLYYMQTVFPWLFTIDNLGWGGGASFADEFQYKEKYSPLAFESISKYVSTGKSKFPQPKKVQNYKRSLKTNSFIFVPLQIPHDQTIIYHSNISVEEFVSKLCRWVGNTDFEVDIIFKGHPANIKSMTPLVKIITSVQKAHYITDASIHGLIEACDAVYVLNSGVGQEAMVHKKPVVSFAKSEYAAAAIAGDIDNLDTTWHTVCSDDRLKRIDIYKSWYDWYLTDVCHDVSEFVVS